MSATSMIRTVWYHVWHTPNVWMLAFWYAFITSMYQQLVATKLVAGLPASWKNVTVLHMPSLATLPHGTIIKLVLVYLTFLLIISPLTFAGLYGGVADALQGTSSRGMLMFFKYAFKNFWKTLAFILLALLSLVIFYGIIVLIRIGILLLSHQVAALGSILGITFLIFMVAFIFLWLFTLFLWLGAIFSGQETIWGALATSVKWVRLHAVFAFRMILLVIGLGLVFILAVRFILAIPLVGMLLAIWASMFIPLFLAMFANLVYREGLRHDIPRRD